MNGSEPGIVARLRAAGCVFAEDEARLLVSAAVTRVELDEMTTRRVGGEPLEVILGWAEFCGLRIAVDRGVFVPRQRSAFLVQQAALLLQPASFPAQPASFPAQPASLPAQPAAGRAGPRAVVVDLCCGTGALAAALAAQVPGVELYAADIEPAAVACARRNLEPLGGQVFPGDLYDALPPALRGRVDILVVNAPYVPTAAIATMPPEARDHEPAVALDGGPDGTEVHRRVAEGAPGWLAPGGHLLIETGRRQASLTAGAVAGHGLDVRVVSSEELSCTVVIGTRRAPGSTGGREAGSG